MPVLVVDDFATMRKIVRSCLAQLGLTNVTEADNGKHALEKLKEGDFKLIVSDWNMPEMMGIDLLRAVRSNDKLKTIPFVMVTAEAQKENVIEAVKAGVSNYIIKPFNAEQMREKLTVVFNKK